jgi:hypothetical protein
MSEESEMIVAEGPSVTFAPCTEIETEGTRAEDAVGEAVETGSWALGNPSIALTPADPADAVC